MRIKQYLDFAFIPCYVALYIALARMLGTRSAAIATFVADRGIADVMENVGILRVVNTPLARTTQRMVDAIRIPSLIKWALTWVAIAIFASLFLRAAGWLRRSIGALDACGGRARICWIVR